MDTYRVRRRVFIDMVMRQPGEEVQLKPSHADRLRLGGFIEGPLPKPKRTRKKRVKDGNTTD